MPDRSFWKGRQVFLTGHTGFKGSWLSLWLDALGADVTGYALDPPTQPSLFEQAKVSTAVRSICADIRDFPRLKTALAECRPDVVIHMAAQSVVRRGYEDPIETYSSNVMGTVHLLEAYGSSDNLAWWSMSRATSAMKTENGTGDTGKMTLWADMTRIQTAKLVPNWLPRRSAIPISARKIWATQGCGCQRQGGQCHWRRRLDS